MKKLLFILPIALIAVTACGQADKTKRPSPPAKAEGATSSGTMIAIDYSQPGVKGRTIGKDLDPLPGKVWRTGANEATVFEVNKDVKIEGKPLPAGKYSLYSINNGDDWTIIFNKKWNQWGTVYSQAEDALRVNVKGGKSPKFAERMTFEISKDGKVSLMWGDKMVAFQVE
ncbi:MAG: DUF2911 domain-containing protein [Bacteroidetes bacterium]|nr:DUF2911 domain-containing protein [Bacteroidota bacterium]MBS1973902.1 DUF2911 domain-containing protein [Bacteroidota bacterium]